jgi:hypothetical protein
VPTLFIVGGNDHVAVELNRGVQARMRCETRLAVVRSATHLSRNLVLSTRSSTERQFAASRWNGLPAYRLVVVLRPALRGPPLAHLVVLGPLVEMCEQLAGRGWNHRGFVVFPGKGSDRVQ